MRSITASRFVSEFPGAPGLAGSLTTAIVVCTRNRPEALCLCLEAIGHLEPAPDEVLVVDNSAGNPETHAAALKYRARYVIEPVPGLSRARNRGMAESRCDVVAYIDDDARPESNWLRLLVEPFADSNVAVATGMIKTPDSALNKSTPDSPRVLSNKDPLWFEIATFGGLGLGSNMAVRKTACGGKILFNEQLGRGAPIEIAEESYAFAWLLSHGFKAVYVPTAVVFHPPLRRVSIEIEARNSFGYWLLLFSDFPRQRPDLLRFLYRRLRGKNLSWPRNPQEPGEIVSSGWRVKLRAVLSGALLYLRTRKPQPTTGA